MRLAAFAPEAPFLASLAQAWLAAPGDPSEGLLILPNRRSARALAGAFLQANQAKALLLPRIIAIGALDEAALSISEHLSLAPAISGLDRQAMLAKLILARNGRNGAPRKLAAAWALAADLAALLDEADLAEIDLRAVLPGIVAEDLATHWEKTLQFLEIITHAWPAILDEIGCLNPVMRQNFLIDAQRAAWTEMPPETKIWLVARDANPALLRLAKTIAQLAAGAVILPGYDHEMTQQAWDNLEDSHPQTCIASMIAALGVRREEIQIWRGQASAVPAARARLLSKVLLPAKSLHEWQMPDVPAPEGIYRLAARDEHDEALAIAMALRDALEVPGRTVALVTPDRALAQRTSAHLQRFGIMADDSAGEPIKQTPPAVLLRLLAQAALDAFAPVPLLALLQHPLAANGEAPEACRNHARRLEISALRGIRPAPGFAGIKYRLAETGDTQTMRFIDQLELSLMPIASLPVSCNPADALHALVVAAETLCATDEETGIERLWGGDAGLALSQIIAEAIAAMTTMPEIAPEELGSLLDAILEGCVIRRPRTKDGHPRVAIWGVQEASLQTVDFVVLGGLAEGVWPEGADPGPWMSRPMRKSAGLPTKEQQIGVSANDFFSLCCQTPHLVLSAAKRRGRAPAVQARWLTRFDALLGGHGMTLTPHPAASWSAQIDLPKERLFRPKPAPRPAANLRPRMLSITEFATMMSNPYAIYLRKILRINPLDALDEESDAGMFGNIVHAGLADYFTHANDPGADGAAEALNLALQLAMRAKRPRAALEHWWDARLQRIAKWVIETEAERCQLIGRPAAIALELSGKMPVGDGFFLNGRADRIERRADGAIFILDYKTGTAPEAKKMMSGAAPQLPLEAVMAEAGAFGAAYRGRVEEIAIWKLSGGRIEGDDKSLTDENGALRLLIDRAAERLPVLFEIFSDARVPYLAMPHPDRQVSRDVFEGISRRAEWIDDVATIAS